MLTVDNGFYAGEWGGVDGCVTGSYAYAVQLRVSGTLFLFFSAVRFDFFLNLSLVRFDFFLKFKLSAV